MGKAPQELKKKQDFKNPISPLWLGMFFRVEPKALLGSSKANAMRLLVRSSRIRGLRWSDIRVIEPDFLPVSIHWVARWWNLLGTCVCVMGRREREGEEEGRRGNTWGEQSRYHKV